MRIAFVSYECPPDTAFGGIATYVLQAARALAARGHDVEVFAASPTLTSCQKIDDVTVNRIHHTSRETFRSAIAPLFVERHRINPFDILEGPEFQADASEIIKLVPDLPFVLRLHTPTYLCRRISRTNAITELRIRFGAWRRGLPHPDSPFHPSLIHELNHARQADAIVSPSESLADIVSRDWRIPRESVQVIPNVYVPSDDLLKIPIRNSNQLVLFVGRLEMRKGVLDLAAAIPDVLRRVPEARFRFVGKAMASPRSGIPMDDYLRTKLRADNERVEFVGSVVPEEIPSVLADAQLCVFPSRWENFPTVCLEAMCAGRAIIGTRNTGFAEQLGDGQAGWLVPPRSPRTIARTIINALSSPDECASFGAAARERVLKFYSAEAICPQQEACYQAAIAHRADAGPRQMRKNIA